MVDLPGAVEQRPQLAGGHARGGDGEAADEEDVVTSEYAHRPRRGRSPLFIGTKPLSLCAGFFGAYHWRYREDSPSSGCADPCRRLLTPVRGGTRKRVHGGARASR